MTKRNALASILGASLIFLGIATAQKDGIERHPDPAILAGENVKALLLLIDADKNGKITKEEWMRFMSAEFDRHMHQPRSSGPCGSCRCLCLRTGG